MAVQSLRTKSSGPSIVDVLAGKVSSATVTTIVSLTQAEYDALTPDAATLYVITD